MSKSEKEKAQKVIEKKAQTVHSALNKLVAKHGLGFVFNEATQWVKKHQEVNELESNIKGLTSRRDKIKKDLGL